MADPFFIVVWRANSIVTTEGPDQDATVFRSESDMIGEIAEEDGVGREVLQVIRVPPDGPPVAVAPDYLESVCREYLADWEAERQHRESLRRVG